MSRCTTFTFQVSISTKVSFKITIRKRHDYIDFRLHWKWKQYFYLGIWYDERTKIIFLPSFQLVTRLNSQNRNETILLTNSDTLIFIWMLAFPIGIIQVSTPRKWSFFTLLQFLTRLLTSNHSNFEYKTRLVEMEWCEERAFQLLKMRKVKVIWIIKTKCVTDFLLTVRSSSMKDYTCHYVEST